MAGDHVTARSDLPSTRAFEPEHAWQLKLQENIRHLASFREGWDGPGSLPVADRVLSLAGLYVREALRNCDDAKIPFLVPAGDGSVQVEWHEHDKEIEFSIERDGKLHFWFRDHTSGYEFERGGEEALDSFRYWAPRIASRSRDVDDVLSPDETLSAETT